MAAALSRHGYKCGVLNIQSVRNKTFDVCDLIKEEGLDIFALTETWLNEYEYAVINEMTPVTHSFIHVPRSNRQGGGVGIFLSNSFNKIRKVGTERCESFELLRVDCEINSNKMTILVIYRPPGLSVRQFIDEFREYLDTLDMVSANILICGDFNIRVNNPGERYVTEFIDTMNSFNLINSVDKPTSAGGHIIDLVFSDGDKELINNLQVDEICSLSPVHKLITFTIRIVRVQKHMKSIKFRSKRCFEAEALIETILNKVTAVRSSLCVHGHDRKDRCVTCFSELFNNIIYEEYNEMCPMIEKDIIIKDSAPWFNSEVNQAKREKKRKERLWRKHRTDETRAAYTQAKNKEKRLIIATKREYYSRKTLEAGKDINKFYRTLNDLTGYKKKNKLPEGFLDRELANKFIDFFDDKIKNIINDFNENCPEDSVQVEQRSVPELRSFHTVDSAVIKTTIKKVKMTYCVNDPLPMKEIVHSTNFDSMVALVTDLINVSIKENKFPETEKRAIVKPIVKGKLDTQELSSFRPVSNLTFLSKLMENVILDQLSNHLEAVGALPDNQSAYKRFYSTETALCSVVSDMRSLIDNGKCGILILLDLSAAFDTVVHSLLLRDCCNIGITGSALAYLKSYLESRTYRVQIGDSFSEPKTLERGVPQGSVLGPVLFCIYTIELSHLLSSHGVDFKLFADDTQFYMSLSNVENCEEKLTSIMVDIGKWMAGKQLKLNENKTECLIVGKPIDVTRINMCQLKVNNQYIKVSKNVKNLGVILDSELSMKDQINETVKKASYHLKNITFVKKYLDEKAVQMLVQNHVISKLDYCNCLYYGAPNYLLRKLQMVMNRAARIVKGLSLRERITPALIDLHWLPMKARVVYKQCVLVYQTLQSGKPVYLRNILQDFHVNTDILLRHGVEINRLNEQRYNTEVGRRAFKNSAPRLYNSLPRHVKEANNVQTFRKRLKTFLFTDSYDLMNKVVKQPYSW